MASPYNHPIRSQLMQNPAGSARPGPKQRAAEPSLNVKPAFPDAGAGGRTQPYPRMTGARKVKIYPKSEGL